MKKIMILAMATMLSLTMMGCGSGTSTDTSAEETTAKEVATEVATEAVDEDEDVSLFSANVDIDQDGNDEFIISTTADSFLQQGDSAVIIANVDDETLPLLTVTSEAGAELRSDEADSALTVFTRCSGEQHAVVYELKDGKLEQVKTLDHWEAGHGDAVDTDLYRIDGEDATQEDFESAWEQYYENATAISYTDTEE